MSSANRCFSNSLIVQKILRNVDVIDELQLRLVNRTCDEELLGQIRRLFRKVTIEVKYEIFPEVKIIERFMKPRTIEVEDEILLKVKINGRLVKPRSCFQFLISTVGVKVKELEVVKHGKRKWTYSPKFRELHDDILEVLLRNQTLNVFKGMNSLCNRVCHSCKSCGMYAIQCKEYGPVQSFEYLNDVIFKKAKHFDKLIVDDQLLWNTVQNYFDIRKHRLTKLERYIQSKTSCNHLQLQLYDDPEPSVYTGPGFSPILNDSLPRDILEEMCRKWKVKSIGISFQSQEKGETWWSYKQKCFTDLCWFSPPESISVSTGFLLDYVEVDLEKAPTLYNGVFGDDGSQYPANYNLIANIRKVFPAKQYYFNGHRMSERTIVDRCPGMITDSQLSKMLYSAMLGTSRLNNSPVTIRLWIKATEPYLHFPDKFEKFGWRFTGSLSELPILHFFDGTERIGRSLKYRETATGCEINLEIYVEEKETMEIIMKNTDC